MKAPLYPSSVPISKRGHPKCQLHSHETSSQEDNRVDNSDNPFVASLALDVEFFVECQIGSVGASLIPSLGGSSDSAKTNRVPQHPGTMPLVVSLIGECVALFPAELRNRLEIVGLSRNDSSAAKQSGVLGHVVGFGESLGIEDGLLPGDALEKRMSMQGLNHRAEVQKPTVRGFSTMFIPTGFSGFPASATLGLVASVMSSS